jgi:hypothetical protein
MCNTKGVFKYLYSLKISLIDVLFCKTDEPEAFCLCRVVIAEIHLCMNFLLSARVSCRDYLNFLLMYLTELKDVYINASSHIIPTQRCFTTRCIGRGTEAPVSWSASSADLNPVDFFCESKLKPSSTPVQSILERNCDVRFNNLRVN